ncbi:hypothetical protein FQY83_14720 [Luteimonas marina]|uniref:Glycosyltransferase RgtA/B/C/D-like domain-containing protein n=1 Tax=Luteimonas marina TaxID=488485 RepID=A0A5C5TY83_9GAMM|nr:hypothetical protein [Luteimonas marina]TWT18627.1 hypothetical protein FQY83_14720 [Luteimonas marina]
MHDATARMENHGHSRLDVAAMVAITLLSLVAKYIVLDPVGPLIFFDELLYKLGADALAGHGDYPSAQYPFLYPLLLAPAVASGASYDGIVLTNVLVTSTLVPACWLLAKACGAKWGWPSAAIAAVLPIQFTFPTQAMAENLFVPLFTFCIWYAVRAKPVGWLSAFVFGLMLAGTYLTKYLALPAVPVLWVIWLYGMWRNGVARPGLVPPAASSVAGGALLLLAWVWYAGENGIGVTAAFGGDVYDGFADRNAITLDAIALWTVAYLSTMVLLVGPFLYRFLEAGVHLVRHPLRLTGESAFYRLVLVCLLFLGGYTLVCVQHSVQLAMNHPDPQRIVARYFMQLVPAVFVAGMVHTLAGDGVGRLRLLSGIVSALCLAGAAFAAHGVLYRDFVWDFPDWFAAIPLYATDILGYRQGIGFWLLLVLVLLGPAAATGRIGRWLLAAGSVVLVACSAASVNRDSEVLTTSRPTHAKELLPYVTATLDKGESALIIAEIPRLGGAEIKQALAFWGVPVDRVNIVGSQQISGFGTDVGDVYRLSLKREEQRPLLREYPVGQGWRKTTAYIYRDALPPARGVESSALEPRAAFTATPASLCARDGAAVVDLSWDVPPDIAKQVTVSVLASDGREQLFAATIGTGRQSTGPWAMAGTEFTLRHADTGRLLSTLKIGSADCGGG